MLEERSNTRKKLKPSGENSSVYFFAEAAIISRIFNKVRGVMLRVEEKSAPRL